MQYDPRLIQPFRDELIHMGFKELRTVEDVDKAIQELKGVNMVVVNSVCGCAAGKARPGIGLALQQSPFKPDHLTTVFAGGDVQATERMRQHIGPFPPSSPSMAFFKDGKLVHFIPRYQIESRDAFQISKHLLDTFKELCSPATQPSSAVPA